MNPKTVVALETPLGLEGNWPINQWVRRSQEGSLRRLLSCPVRAAFALGLPHDELLPREQLLEAHSRISRRDPALLQLGPPQAELKEHIKELMRRRGVECDQEEIFLTTGAQQGLDLVARLLIAENGCVCTDDVTYPGLIGVVRAQGAGFLTVPSAPDDSMDVNVLEESLKSNTRPAFIYLMCDGHNPRGVSMSEEKRQDILHVASRFGVPIVEDDAYGLLSLDGRFLRPLSAYNRELVIYVGTFSKLLGPALRVGWLVVPRWMVRHLSVIKDLADIDSATLPQRLVTAYLSTGAMESHLAKVRAEYRISRDSMLASLREYFPPNSRWTQADSGVFLWVELDSKVDTANLLEASLREGITFVPGTAFSPDASTAANCMRLNFTYCQRNAIDEGIRRLGELLSARSQPAGPVSRKDPPEDSSI